jgi:chloramphenicol-sensitive protein RarD
MNRGVWYAVGAYLLWGLLPVYWKALQTVPALQILNHRVVWSLGFLTAILLIRRDWEPLRLALKSRRILLIYLATSCLLGVNWLTYIWGVNAGFIVETSLGYFINPLVSVLLGVLFLREKLRPGQWIPVGLAALGVIYLTISYQKLPWIALVLAITFGLYGLIKKIAPLNSLHSLALETALLFVPSLAYLLWAEAQGIGAFGHAEFSTTLLLVFTGVVTALPLLLFGAGARLIPLSLIGLLQYLAPTLQFLIGVLIYGEPFTWERMIGFGIIWVALVIYTLEGVLAKQRQRS